jgi:hypothetical protein
VLARRLTGKYLTPRAEHLLDRVAEIEAGKFDIPLDEFMQKPSEELRDLYNRREIEA